MAVDNNRELANIIAKNIRREFNDKKLLGRTQNSVQVIGNKIIISPKAYDMWLYISKGVIKDEVGSYSSELDLKGSQFGNHKDFITKAIDTGIREWKQKYNINCGVKKQWQKMEK